MESKEIICADCGKPTTVKHRKAVRCPICKDLRNKEYQRSYQRKYQPAYQKEYQKMYQKAYTDALQHKRTNKRVYRKSGVTAELYLNYCRQNNGNIQGCLNCICPECLEPLKSDDFLLWEREEQFFERDHIRSHLN